MKKHAPLNTETAAQLLAMLEERFMQHPERHADIPWKEVYKRLEADPQKLRSIHAMEESGGEPDVIGRATDGDMLLICDCSAESPTGRRSLCYDAEALASRSKNKPSGSAMQMANEMGISLLNETQYRFLQTLGTFDTKTSSWILTPDTIRTRGGALFCDRRYDAVFTYHNGAESYYAARGFRGMLLC